MKRASLLVTDFMLFVILVIADQLTKHLAVVRLKNQAAYNLINGILEFNDMGRGAAPALRGKPGRGLWGFTESEIFLCFCGADLYWCDCFRTD